jgi:hypothetical protein
MHHCRCRAPERRLGRSRERRNVQTVCVLTGIEIRTRDPTQNFRSAPVVPRCMEHLRGCAEANNWRTWLWRRNFDSPAHHPPLERVDS